MKKVFNWRWLMMIVAAVAMGVSFAACGDDDNDKNSDEPGGGEDVISGTPAEKLIGVWTSYDDDYDEYEYYRFNADGTGFMSGDDARGTDAEWFVSYRVRYSDRNDTYRLEILWDEGDYWEEEAEVDFYSSRLVYFNWGSGWYPLNKR